METKAHSLGCRIGSNFKRLRSFLKNHESRLVRKAGKSYPKFGAGLARLLFLAIKVGLVLLAISGLFVAAYVAFLGFIVAFLVFVMRRNGDAAADEHNKYWEQKVEEEDYYHYYLRDDHL